MKVAEVYLSALSELTNLFALCEMNGNTEFVKGGFEEFSSIDTILFGLRKRKNIAMEEFDPNKHIGEEFEKQMFNIAFFNDYSTSKLRYYWSIFSIIFLSERINKIYTYLPFTNFIYNFKCKRAYLYLVKNFNLEIPNENFKTKIENFFLKYGYSYEDVKNNFVEFYI